MMKNAIGNDVMDAPYFFVLNYTGEEEVLRFGNDFFAQLNLFSPALRNLILATVGTKKVVHLLITWI